MNCQNDNEKMDPKIGPGGYNNHTPSVSVIIPAYNCEDTIVRTLESVDNSIAYCKSKLGAFESEVIVVIDNASDNTALLTKEFARNKAGYHIVYNRHNHGAGPSRNIGVRHSRGDLLFFLDGDDIYFEDHIALCVYHMMRLPQVHYAQTRVCIEENIHPVWKTKIEESLPINICVRRWCHDFIGGYFEDDVFKICTCEDVMYREMLMTFCPGLKINKETVQHFRYPGNALDRQMHKFSLPPEAGINSLTESEKAVMPEIYKIKSQREEEIKTALTHWTNFLDKPDSILTRR